MQDRIDLDALAEAIRRCDNEPIQFIGSVQSYGVLIGVDALGVIQVASANLAEVFGMPAANALGLPASLVLGEALWCSITSLGELLPNQPPLALALEGVPGSPSKPAFVHRSGDLRVIEMACREETECAHPIDPGTLSRVFAAILADTASVADYAQALVQQVHTLTGFDRVMVYQFDADWNGQVIAESNNAQVSSFLGHFFPASDIPEPARRLYARNLVRMLVDRDAAPVPLLQANRAAAALDLSFSVLRSISPVHLKYLENLDVVASVTVSLLQHGRLWGLMVCHHRQPRRLPLKLRDDLELIARSAAIRLSALAMEESLRFQERMRQASHELLLWTQGAPNLANLPGGLQQQLLNLVQASGLALLSAGECYRFGHTPPPVAIVSLQAWLLAQASFAQHRQFSSSVLASQYAPGQAHVAVAAGVLALPLDDAGNSMVLWFRGEVVRDITWAGQAQKHLVEDALGPLLAPRSSFALWRQTQRGQSLAWLAQQLDAAQTLSLLLGKILADQQLRHNQESLRVAALVYEASSEAMVVTDAASVVMAINPAFTALTGYVPEEVIGRTLSILKSGRQDAVFYQAMWQSIQNTGSWRGELWNRHKNGDLYAEYLTVNTIFDDHGAVWRRVGLVTDITSRKLEDDAIDQNRKSLEQLVLSRTRELETARDDALAANRAKSRFLANMSHELRTPMNAVLGMINLLKGTSLDLKQLDYAEKSESAARSLLGLLNDILDFSKVEAGMLALEAQPFALEQLMRELAIILSANVDRKPVEVLFDVDASLPELVVGDILRLKQVLINLSSNALKFTNNGEVLVSVKLQQRLDDVATLEFAVKDTGIGIAADQLHRIFDAFTQAEASTTRRFGGTGLGLAISQKLVALMGGELQVQSTLGVGSRFYFSLPLRVMPAAVPKLSTPPVPLALEVLVVDDNAVACRLMVALLLARGIAATGVCSGAAALQLMCQRQAQRLPPFAVVLLDWQMPDMDGWETARQIQALDFGEHAAPHLIMVTANGRAMLGERTAAEQALLSGFLAKPVSPAMLLDTIADACAAHPLARQPQKHSQRGLERMRILVVEDNLLNQQVAEELLGREGALVSLAANGQQGVQAVAAADPPFDVVLMDLQMPVLDGFAATHVIREELGLKTLPIIAMSANVMAEDIRECLAAGMNDHVGKPFELTRLVALLRHQAGWTSLAAPDSKTAKPVTSALPAVAQVQNPTGQIDLAQALEWVDGNVALYREFARGYVHDIADNADQLALHLARGEQKDALRIMHTLKGLSRTVGANALADFAAAYESELKNQPLDPQKFDAMVQQTRERIATVSAEIGQIVEKNLA